MIKIVVVLIIFVGFLGMLGINIICNNWNIDWVVLGGIVFKKFVMMVIFVEFIFFDI